MNKSQIIKEMSCILGISQNKTKQIVDLFLNQIALGLNKDDKVVLSGFGTFYILEEKANKPPKKRKPRFKVGTELNSAVN
jgi:nucleoid DNA-binding protein